MNISSNTILNCSKNELVCHIIIPSCSGTFCNCVRYITAEYMYPQLIWPRIYLSTISYLSAKFEAQGGLGLSNVHLKSG